MIDSSVDTTRSQLMAHMQNHHWRGGKAAILALGLLCGPFLSGAALAQAVPLGAASSFGVLAASAITSTGGTVVTGDLGISPNNASSVAGFIFSTPPGTAQVTGSTHFADAVAATAQNNVTAAYNTLAGLPCSASVSADLGGQTLTPGVYCSASSLGLTGTVTLDAQGNPDATFIFQAGSLLTTASNSVVNIINGGQSCNVFWQVGSSATLGTGTRFLGSVLALTSITLTSNATVNGRLLARDGAVTLDSNAITVCTLAPPPANPPTLTTSFSPSGVNAGAASTLTLTLTNPDSAASTLSAPLTDTLPSGVVVAALPNATTTCAGGAGVTAAAGSGSVRLSAGAVIPAGGSCTVAVAITGTVGGSYVNTLPAGALVTSTGSNVASAIATLMVTPAPIPNPPSLSKSFSPASIGASEISTLTVTLTNPSTAIATLTAGLVDTLPAGLVIATPASASSSCGGGLVDASPGGNSVTLAAGSSVPAKGACAIRVNVTSSMAGVFVNTLNVGALVTSNGSNAVSTVATLTVTPVVTPPVVTPGSISPIPMTGAPVLAVIALLMIVLARRRIRSSRRAKR